MVELLQKYERMIWEAFRTRCSEAFLAVVDADAVMVCGNYRCLASEYANYIAQGGVDRYEFIAFELAVESPQLYCVHYVVRVESDDPDLSGTFHVCSLWKPFGEGYRLVFNMDSRIS